MMRFYSLLLVIALFPGVMQAIAQDNPAYQTLRSRNEIPADFIDKSSERYQQDLATKVSKNDKRFTRKSKEAFYLKSNFNIGRFLNSGKVLFNDEVSVYLGQVLDELLKNDTTLRNKLRIYTVKSPAVNAYTTENGIIFVNLGLLARLENEAQLAYILSHEIIHFKEKHVINGYVKAREISAAKGDYRRLSFDEKMFTKSTYDKEQELEADQMGLDIFLQSGYDRRAGEQVFDILNLADYPALERKFRKEYFEKGAYQFPEYYYLANVKAVQAEEDFNDSLSSHPNIKKRKEALEALLQHHKEQQANGAAFLVSKNTFEEVKRIAGFELSRSYLLGGDAVDALLHAYSMEAAYPESDYLRKNIMKALYSMARFGHEGKPDDERGEKQRLLYFFKDFTESEFYVLALRNLYQYREQHPEDEEIDLMVLDLVYEAAIKDEDFERRFSKFGAAPQKPFEDKDKAYLHYAFSDVKDEAAFFTYLEEKSRKARKWDADRKKRKKKKDAWKAPSVERTVVINPLYMKVDTRKKEKVRYEDSEAVLTNIDHKVARAANELGMEAQILNTLNFSGADVAKFNDHSIIQEWLIEKLRHDTPTGISPIHNEIKVISEAYGTSYFTWMGGIALTERRPFNVYHIVYSVLYPPSIPLWLYQAVKTDKNSFYFSYTFDVRNEGVIEGEMRRIRMKDNESLMQSNIYHTLFQLKN